MVTGQHQYTWEPLMDAVSDEMRGRDAVQTLLTMHDDPGGTCTWKRTALARLGNSILNSPSSSVSLGNCTVHGEPRELVMGRWVGLGSEGKGKRYWSISPGANNSDDSRSIDCQEVIWSCPSIDRIRWEP
ncbi:hypothetical protein BJ165DRAFT_657967 [Panaeolus papilionaceus]|nr:hypothetical protein BJ165DRAFT_657967 [Panaeolus papilionaceus]